jgi:hypothetical protein
MNSEQPGQPDSSDAVLAIIRAAFPDVAFNEQITPADHLLDDEFYDEERDLFAALHGKSWTEVPRSALPGLGGGLPLLTENAFRTFLPAWLKAGLEDPDFRECVVFTFYRDERERDTTFMDERLRPMTSSQMEALRTYFSHLVAIGTSKLERESAQVAFAYIDKLCREQIGSPPP